MSANPKETDKQLHKKNALKLTRNGAKRVHGNSSPCGSHHSLMKVPKYQCILFPEQKKKKKKQKDIVHEDCESTWNFISTHTKPELKRE